MKVIATITAVLTISSNLANAATWQLVADQNNNRMEFDASSVVRHRDIIRLWVRDTPATPQALLGKDGLPTPAIFVYTLSLQEIDCGERTWTLLQGDNYDAHSRIIYSHIYTAAENRTTAIAPESVAEHLLEMVCR